MKKNILYSLLISTVATVGLSSCDAFLEENPKDQITEEQAYQNSTLLYLNTVASLYTQVGANGGGSGLQGTDRGLYDLNTFTTDEAVLPTRGGDWYDGGLWQDVFLHKWGTKNDLVKGSWDYLYRVIAQANKSLDKLAAAGIGVAGQAVVRHGAGQPHKADIMVQAVVARKALVERALRKAGNFGIAVIMGRVVGLPQHPCPEAVGPPADAVGVIAVPLKYFVVVYTVHRAVGDFLGAALPHGAQPVLKACRRGACPVLFGCVQIQHGDSPSIISNASR